MAEKLGLPVKCDDFEELDINAMAKGIGRKATDKELIDLLFNGDDSDPVSLEIAFSKYNNKIGGSVK